METNITIDATVGELLTALGLTELPKGCGLEMASVVEVRGLADVDDLRQPPPEDGGLSDYLDQSLVMGLSAAIRRGDIAEIETLAEEIFGGELITREWLQQGGHSCRARAA
jgi:hypothetical protein